MAAACPGESWPGCRFSSGLTLGARLCSAPSTPVGPVLVVAALALSVVVPPAPVVVPALTLATLPAEGVEPVVRWELAGASGAVGLAGPRVAGVVVAGAVGWAGARVVVVGVAVGVGRIFCWAATLVGMAVGVATLAPLPAEGVVPVVRTELPV